MKDKFIEKSNIIYGSTYDYSLVEYVSSKIKVKIICKEHGIFEKTPANHIRKNKHQGCPKCSLKVRSKKVKKPIDEFIKNAVQIHGDKYDYSLVEYNNTHEKVKIICKIHGIFEQKPCNHIHSRNGCYLCSNKNIKIGTKEFIRRSMNIHGDKYDYSLVEYKNNKTPVKIKIDNCVYYQSPSSHLKGIDISGFHEQKSKGEERISKILDEFEIQYNRQKSFNGCKNKYILHFDFYLPDYNICIEYDGIQHFEPIEFFGGKETLEYNKKIDSIKNEYCKINNILLIRIKYDEDIYEKIYEIKKQLS